MILLGIGMVEVAKPVPPQAIQSRSEVPVRSLETIRCGWGAIEYTWSRIVCRPSSGQIASQLWRRINEEMISFLPNPFDLGYPLYDDRQVSTTGIPIHRPMKRYVHHTQIHSDTHHLDHQP